MKTKKTTILEKSILVGLFSIYSICAFGQEADTIKVSTIDGLFEAIASNKVVLLEEGNYDISKLDVDKKTNSVKIQRVESAEGGVINNLLIISGVSNLKIIGIGKKKSKIYTPSSEVSVLSFKNCENVTLDNIDAGHKTTELSCIANVIDIENSENFIIKNSYLYGSGYIGIYGNNVKKLSIVKTTITECSSELLYLDNCMNTTIDSCVLSKTKGGFTISNCLNLTISNSEISEIVQKGSMQGDLFVHTYLFNISASANIKLLKCLFEGNETSYLLKSSLSINLDTETDFKDNKFIGMFEN